MIIAFVPVLAGCAWWALAPIQSSHAIATTGLDEAIPVVPSNVEARPPIAPDVFNVALWNPPPLPTPPSVPIDAVVLAPPPPLNIQLIGIITEVIDGHKVHKAAIYDADADRLMIITDGEHLRQHTVRIHEGGLVELVDGVTTRQLRLRPDLPGLGKEAS